MNAVVKPQRAIDIARQIATSIEHSNEDPYKAIASALLIAAESDADLRQQGKGADLSMGYEGGVGAMRRVEARRKDWFRLWRIVVNSSRPSPK